MGGCDERIRPRNDHIDAQPNQLRGQFRQPFQSDARVATLECKVAAVDETEKSQCLDERAEQRRRILGGATQENADTVDS